MSRQKSSSKASNQSGFGRLLRITILLSIVFSAGLITGQRILHNASLPPFVSVQSPALSAAAERHLAPTDQNSDQHEVDAPEKTRFSFYEKLSKPDGDDTKITSRRFLTPKPKQEVPAKVVVESAPAPTPNEVPAEIAKPAVAEKPIDDKAIALAAIPDKKPLPALSVNVANSEPEQNAMAARYTLQVGAYPSYERARQEMTRLENMGLEPHVIAADVPGQGKFFRVRVGKFHSMDEARTYQSDTREKNSLDTFVTPL